MLPTRCGPLGRAGGDGTPCRRAPGACTRGFSAFRRAAVAVCLTVVLLLAVALPALPGNALDELTPAETLFGSWLNAERAWNGLPPMVFDGQLEQIAQDQADAMAAAGYAHHSSPLIRHELVDPTRNGWTFAAENVGAITGSDALSLFRLHQAFVRSPGHLENLLQASNRGMGVAIRYSGGSSFVAIEFGGF